MRWLVSLLLIVHGAMLGYSAYVHSPMTDEIGHFAAGLGHWRYGDFELYNVNPPLARTIGTLPVYLFMPWDDDAFGKSYSSVGSSYDKHGAPVSHRKEFLIGDQLFKQIEQSYLFWLITARWACVPFSCLGAWVCFNWASDLYGTKAGFTALVLWCTSPLVLAFGGALTPDVPSGAMGILAMYRYWKWTTDCTWANAYLAGLAIGLAELTKSTWILLHPMLFLIGLGLCLTRLNRLSIAAQCAFQLTIAWIVLLAGYGFTDQFKPLGECEFSSPQLQIREYSESGELRNVVTNRFRDTWMATIPVPLPTELVRGVDTQESAMASQTIVGFLCGELRLGGWWYYYLVVLAVKCTVGELGLFAIATLGACRSDTWSISRLFRMDLLLLLGPVVLYLGLLSYHTGLNRHARYMVQFLPFCFVWASQAINFFPHRLLLRFGTVALLVFGSLSSLFYFPHSLSYFNELFGGPSQGHKYLSGTNIDWGHNVYYLRDEIKRRRWDSVGMSLWTRYDLKLAGIEAQITKIPKLKRVDVETLERIEDEAKVLQPGRYAVSVCIVQGTMGFSETAKKGVPIDNGMTYFQDFKPVGHVGYSIWLYELSEKDILESKAWGNVYRIYLDHKAGKVTEPSD